MKRRLMIALAALAFGLVAMGADSCDTTADDSVSKPAKKERSKGSETSVPGVSSQELADLNAEVLIADKGDKWLREFCDSADLLGEELALEGFRGGWDRQEGVSARMMFDALRDHC